LSFIVLCIVCCKSKSISSAAEAVEEAAECIMSMPTLLIEPFLSFIMKVPFFIAGLVGLALLITSGDHEKVDLTQPSSLLSSDNLSLVCAVYYFVVFLWVMELFHYVSVWVVIFTAETWFFTNRGKRRGGLCSNCGPTVMCRGYTDGMIYHLGSLIYGALLSSLLKFVRIIAQLLLSLQEQNNPLGKCISAVIGCCLACVQKIVDLTSKVAFMDIALNGNVGYCTSATRALTDVFSNGTQWATVEGFATLFYIGGVGAIGAGTGGLVLVIVSEVDRYKDVNSPVYVSDPKNAAIAAALVAAVLASIFLHIFDTVADTMAYCKGVQKQRAKAGDEEDESHGSLLGCFGCYKSSPKGSSNSETRRLLG